EGTNVSSLRRDNNAPLLRMAATRLFEELSVQVAYCAIGTKITNRGKGAQRKNRRTLVRPSLWTGGPLDRVAQIAERKYCRPQARPFRLGFPRKVPVFPICPPAAL